MFKKNNYTVWQDKDIVISQLQEWETVISSISSQRPAWSHGDPSFLLSMILLKPWTITTNPLVYHSILSHELLQQILLFIILLKPWNTATNNKGEKGTSLEPLRWLRHLNKLDWQINSIILKPKNYSIGCLVHGLQFHVGVLPWSDQYVMSVLVDWNGTPICTEREENEEEKRRRRRRKEEEEEEKVVEKERRKKKGEEGGKEGRKGGSWVKGGRRKTKKKRRRWRKQWRKEEGEEDEGGMEEVAEERGTGRKRRRMRRWRRRKKRREGCIPEISSVWCVAWRLVAKGGKWRGRGRCAYKKQGANSVYPERACVREP